MKADREDSKPLISMQELGKLFYRWKKELAISALVFASLFFAMGLLSPLRYSSEASFKDTGRGRNNLSDSFAALMPSLNGESDGSAAVFFRSRCVLSPTIEEIGLNAIVQEEPRWPMGLRMVPWAYERIRDNVIVEWAHWKQLDNPVIDGFDAPLQLQQVVSSEQGSVNFRLRMEDGSHYTLLSRSGTPLAEGEIGRPMTYSGAVFRLRWAEGLPVDQREHWIGRLFSVKILPMSVAVERTRRLLSIEKDRSDKKVICLRCSLGDRYQAANFLNVLMSQYKRHIIGEYRTTVASRLEYLTCRQNEVNRHFESVMQQYGNILAEDLVETGFANSETAMQFFMGLQAKSKEKLALIQLEQQRLDLYQGDTLSYGDWHQQEESLEIDRLLEELRGLKQQKDGLDLALMRANEEEPVGRSAVGVREEGFRAFEETQQAIREVRLLESSLQNRNQASFPETPLLSRDRRYLIIAWEQRLAESSQGEYQDCCSAFLEYLRSLRRVLEVYRDSLKDGGGRYSQEELAEFEGITLKTGFDLYGSYTGKLAELDVRVLDTGFVSRQLLDPDFEISSLSGAIVDPVSSGIIQKASQLSLELRDTANRSERELLRMRRELAEQREFLLLHLEQVGQILQLQQRSLRAKIHSLQRALRELVQERLAVLQKHFSEYVTTRLQGLQRDEQVIAMQEQSMRKQMTWLPQQWMLEQHIRAQVEIGKSIVEEVAKLVESQNIANNIESLQSAPIDEAFPPLHANSPRLFLRSFLGALFGIALVIAVAIFRDFHSAEEPFDDKKNHSA